MHSSGVPAGREASSTTDNGETRDVTPTREAADQDSSASTAASKRPPKAYRKPSIVRHGNLRMMTQLE
jgi:hypothetical protein